MPLEDWHDPAAHSLRDVSYDLHTWQLVRDTGGQTVAAAVDGNDLGAVQQTVEDDIRDQALICMPGR